MRRHCRDTALLGLAAVFLLAALPASAEQSNRCGWLQNPTPGNWWLTDRDGDWIMSFQGENQDLPGMDLVPDVTEHDFVTTNGNYGYACACMTVDTDASGETKRITAIRAFRQLALSKCSRDKTLPKPD